MTAEHIFRTAASSEPVVFTKTARILKQIEETDTEAFQETVGEFGKIAGFASGELEKVAGIGADMAVAAGGGIIAALGTAVAMDLFDAAKRGLTKGNNYQNVMALNPDLKRLPKNNVRRAFDAIHRFGGPEITADPMVTGVMVKHLAELPEMSPETIFKVISARKGIQDSRKLQQVPTINHKSEKGSGPAGRNPPGFLGNQ